MVTSAVHQHPQSAAGALDPVAEGLAGEARAMLARALEFAEPLYAGQTLSTGEPIWPHALGLATTLAAIGMDPAARAAGLLFAAPKFLDGSGPLETRFGAEIARLAEGVEKLYQLRVVTRSARRETRESKESRDQRAQQTEVLRKMVLAMVEDIRVVPVRVASRTQTLRWFVRNPGAERSLDERDPYQRDAYARETLDIYSPLANRLGLWQLKWEMEDLAFRILESETYQKIARMIDEKRLEREQYIGAAMRQLSEELAAAGVQSEIAGRPKHIYSIWNKMRAKSLAFEEVYDVRALRVIVDNVASCYTALGVVHNLWQPIPKEFDDYISRPKGNDYQSLHTAVVGPGGRTLEVQIRTREMHRHAELGVAAHWRYKEGGRSSRAHAPARTDHAFDQKIAWLRQLLAWRDEVADGPREAGHIGEGGSLVEDTVFVVTPQGKVVDLPAGSTPIDFAYALHSDIGHRCRGAKVDGHMVTLDTPLRNGQRVEIAAAKSGGPSRDWLNAERGFVKSHRARQKIRQWFNSEALAQTIADGRALIEREMRREGVPQANLAALAARLGFAASDELFAAAGRDEVSLRQLQVALREIAARSAPAAEAAPAAPALRAPAPSRGADSGILIVGMDRLLTQLARCCKPLPPDPIRGFVTRGRGVSIHRDDCASLARLAERQPERLVDADWGTADARTGQRRSTYPVDMVVNAADRQGLLRDIGDALARERINVTAVRTQSRDDVAHMRFSFEVADLVQLQRAFAVVKSVTGVMRVARG
jgi:GTP pyrophosphokinase